MKHFLRQLTSRNPVWMVPLALPLVLFASRSIRTAILFSVVVIAVVPLVHSISYFLERQLPRYLRLVSLLIVAATVMTVVELVLVAMGQALTEGTASLLQAMTVMGIMIWPTIGSPLNETFQYRMSIAAGLAVGFVLGFVPLVLVRYLLFSAGYRWADALFVGFLLLTIGRVAVNVVRRSRRERNGAPS